MTEIFLTVNVTLLDGETPDEALDRLTEALRDAEVSASLWLSE